MTKRRAEWEEWIPTVPLKSGPTLRPLAREEFRDEPTDLEVTVIVDQSSVSLRMMINAMSPLPDLMAE